MKWEQITSYHIKSNQINALNLSHTLDEDFWTTARHCLPEDLYATPHHTLPPQHTMLHHTIPHRDMLHCAVLNHTTPHHTKLCHSSSYLLYHGAPHHISLHHTTLCHAINAMPCYATLQSTDAQRIESNQTKLQRVVSYFNTTHHISTYRILLQHHTPYFTTPHTPCRCCFTAYRTWQQDHITPHHNTSTLHHSIPHHHNTHTHICILGVTESSHQSNQFAHIKNTKQECQKMSGHDMKNKDRIGHDKAEVGHTRG
jgi:hypothetical protein